MFSFYSDLFQLKVQCVVWETDTPLCIHSKYLCLTVTLFSLILSLNSVKLQIHTSLFSHVLVL